VYPWFLTGISWDNDRGRAWRVERGNSRRRG
jgi:hypothetical protein